MYRILSNSRSGVKAMETKVNSLADDLANLQTHGYKRKEIGFQELITNEIHEHDVLKSDNLLHSRLNVGVKAGVSTINHQQGILMPSESEFNMAIEGSGFFGVIDVDGNIKLTRNGGFQLNEDNSVSDDNGNLLFIDLEVPKEDWATGPIGISYGGVITQEIEDVNTVLGRVVLFQPHVLDSLIPLGESGYFPVGDVELYNSIDNPQAFGKIVQNFLEASNVHMGKTMTDLIIAQRAYSMNIKTIQSTDEIMSMVNGIKR